MQKIIDFLKQQEIIDCLNINKFGKIYDLAEEQLFGDDVCALSKLFDKANFDVLAYLDEIPMHYKINDKDITNLDLTKYNNIHKIMPYAFMSCINLRNVIINKDLSKIVSSAFENCKNLTDLICNSTYINIGSDAFKGCENLINISFVDSFMQIGYKAFYDCKNLQVIKYGGTIDDWKGCEIDSTAFTKNLQKIICKDGTIDL